MAGTETCPLSVRSRTDSKLERRSARVVRCPRWQFGMAHVAPMRLTSPASGAAGRSSVRRRSAQGTGQIMPDAIEIVLYVVGVVALVSIVIGAVAYVRAEIADRPRSK
jgi:hypothetical protein